MTVKTLERGLMETYSDLINVVVFLIQAACHAFFDSYDIPLFGNV